MLRLRLERGLVYSVCEQGGAGERASCIGGFVMSEIEKKLGDLGIVVPEAPLPAANYVPFVLSGGLLFVSGQLPMEDGAIAVRGKLGGEVSLEEGVRAARLCAINILAVAKKALAGDWERIRSLVKIGGFVSCVPDFTKHPLVVNGASDLLAEVLGERGRHARFAVGAPSLPLDVAVEIEAIFAVRD